MSRTYTRSFKSTFPFTVWETFNVRDGQGRLAEKWQVIDVQTDKHGVTCWVEARIEVLIEK